MVKLIKKIINIIKGTYYNIFNKKTDLARKRMAICTKCKHITNHKVLGTICGECGCVLNSKTRVEDERCELNKW